MIHTALSCQRSLRCENYAVAGCRNYGVSGSRNYGVSRSRNYGVSGSRNYGVMGLRNYYNITYYTLKYLFQFYIFSSIQFKCLFRGIFNYKEHTKTYGLTAMHMILQLYIWSYSYAYDLTAVHMIKKRSID